MINVFIHNIINSLNIKNLIYILMKNKKANIIRSILLNKINKEIISIIKKKGQMRINGKTQEELYKAYSGNYEILIIHKLTTGNSLNQFIKIKNALTLNIDIKSSFGINNLESLSNIENIFQAKKIISEKKLKIIPEIKEKDNNLIKDEKKKFKKGFIKLREIIKNLINRNNTIIHNIDNSKNNKKNYPKKNIKTIFKNKLKKLNDKDKDNNKNNISHKIPSHNYNLDDTGEKKNKKKKLNSSFSQIYKNVIKDKNIVVNQNKRRSIFNQNKLDINKILKLNNSNIQKNNSLSYRNEKSNNSLLNGTNL